jgi:transposase-like protein
MNNKIRKIRARTIWLQTYAALGSISKTARRCGIPRSTLYRWVHRYHVEGKEGLADRSQKPKRLARQRVNEDLKKLILEVRQKSINLVLREFLHFY